MSKLSRLILLFAAVALIGAGVTVDAASKNKDKERPQQDRAVAAIIAGSVFQSSGRSLPGAKVQVVSQADPKIKGETISDPQGDFAIRIPAGRATFVVTATAKGFEPQEKTVEVYESEKVRTNLILKPHEPPRTN